MAKLTFQRLDLTKSPTGDPIEVQFNPTEFTLAKGANYADVNIPGLDAPILQFVRGDAETLDLELFFDGTDSGTGRDADGVVETVDAFYRMVKIEGTLHTPPIVRLTWGNDFPGITHDQSDRPVPAFDCVVTSCQRQYTLFNNDGRPLRAVVTLSLREYKTLEEQLESLNLQSADHTRVHVVSEGDTLPLIAWRAYGNAGVWRVIASHNDLDDVRRLTPGQALELPPTTGV
ncbi:MAG: hypothetical protein AAFX85_13095 [Pseudomonadota bacterium]